MLSNITRSNASGWCVDCVSVVNHGVLSSYPTTKIKSNVTK